MKNLSTFLSTLIILLVFAACGTTNQATISQTNSNSEEAAVSEFQSENAIPFDDALLFIEFNATGGDVGFHAEMGGPAWKQIMIFDPDGNKLFDVKSEGGIGIQGLSSVAFESAEPPLEELPLDEFLARFPEGEYIFIGETIEGESLMSTAEFTHNIPDPPMIISPKEGEIVDREAVVVAWEPVTSPAGIEIDVYQFQVFPVDPPEGQEPIDLNIDLTFEVPSTITQVRIPTEFLMPSVEYEYELLAVEEEGNQTITVGTFVTAP